MAEEVVIDTGEELLETFREPFIGRIVHSKFPCDCEICRSGESALQALYEERALRGEEIRGDFKRPEQWHIEIEPLTVYSRNQHEWYPKRKTRYSKWGAILAAFRRLGYDKFKPEDLIGKVFEWEYKKIQVGTSKREVYVWLPVRELTEEEVKMYTKSEQGTEVPQ